MPAPWDEHVDREQHQRAAEHLQRTEPLLHPRGHDHREDGEWYEFSPGRIPETLPWIAPESCRVLRPPMRLETKPVTSIAIAVIRKCDVKSSET